MVRVGTRAVEQPITGHELQIFFIFAIGVLREWDEFDDFHSVLVFVTAGFGISIILVLVLARVVRDELADSRRSPHLDLAVRVPRYR
ncbi:unnamed protein product [Polarella glacialis]|uniref:Uncharacterized protein n=1 Tax=Polarella glacialis TaxID=89957 RepID=A0A813JXY5_POLGL|nr:unnamed protein product [Polarella glacialis]